MAPGRNKGNSLTFALAFLIVSSGLLLVVEVPPVAASRTWVVDASGHGDYTNLQDAISVAEQGDSIKVLPGSYAGASVPKPVTIFGIDLNQVKVTSRLDITTGVVIRNMSIDKLFGGGNGIRLAHLLVLGSCTPGYPCVYLQTLTNSSVEYVDTTMESIRYGGSSDTIYAQNSVISNCQFGDLELGGVRNYFEGNTVFRGLTVYGGANLTGNKIYGGVSFGRPLATGAIALGGNNIAGDVSITATTNSVVINENHIDGSISIPTSGSPISIEILRNWISGSVAIAYNGIYDRPNGHVIAILNTIQGEFGTTHTYFGGEGSPLAHVWILLNKLGNATLDVESSFVLANDVGTTIEFDGNSNTAVENNARLGVDNGHNNTWSYAGVGNHWLSWTSTNPYPLGGSSHSVDRTPSQEAFQPKLPALPNQLLPSLMRTNSVTIEIDKSSGQILTSVRSNSSLANLQSGTGFLSFDASGLSTLSGFFNVSLSKALTTDSASLTVKVDGSTVQFRLAQDANYFYVYFTAHFSSHSVTLLFAPLPTQTSTATVPSSTTNPQATTTAPLATGGPPTTTSSGGGGIPEFPFQAIVAGLFALSVVTIYLFVRKRQSTNGRSPS